MDTTHEPLRADEWNLDTKISWTYPNVLFESVFCLTEHLNYGDGAKSWVMLGQTLNHSVNPVILCNVLSYTTI
jgi:hypothetical protein